MFVMESYNLQKGDAGWLTETCGTYVPRAVTTTFDPKNKEHHKECFLPTSTHHTIHFYGYLYNI